MGQSGFLATLMVNVTVIQTLTGKIAILAKKITTTIHFVNLVIAIQLESLLNLLDVDQFQLVNFVSAKREFKGEYVISVDHSIGT